MRGGPRPETVATPGSPLYLGLLFAEPERRDDLVAVAALRNELQRSARIPREPAVAGARLQWWQEELGRLADGQPGHPVSRALQPLLADGRVEMTGLEGLLNAADRGTGDLGLLLEMMGHLAGYRDPGREHDMRYVLREIGSSLDHLAELERRSAAGETGLEALAARLETRLTAALARLPASEASRQRAAVVMAVAARARLEALASAQAPGRLAAFRNLWRAWRAARLATRGKLPGKPG